MSTGPIEEQVKPVFWIGSSREDLREFPEEVCQTMGFALWQAEEYHAERRAAEERRRSREH